MTYLFKIRSNAPRLTVWTLAFCIMFAGECLAQKPETKVVGFSAALLNPDSEYNQSYANGMQPGTQVSLLVQMKDQHITELTSEEKAFSMTDSNGKKMKMSYTNIGFMANIADDAESVVFSVASDEVVSKGADSVQVKGKVTCIVGVNLKEEEVSVKLSKGGEMKLAGIDMTIKNIGDHYEEGTEAMTIETKSTLSAIKSIEAIDSNGKVTAVTSAGNSSWGFGNDRTYQQDWVIKGKASKVKKMKVTYFQDLKKVDVPVDLKVGFSLAK